MALALGISENRTPAVEAVGAVGRGGRFGRVVAGLALAALSAGLATLAFPPYGWSAVIWVAWVPMLVAQYRLLPRRWSWLAPGIGIGGYYAGFLHGLVNSSFAWWWAFIPLVVAVLAGITSIPERGVRESTRYARFVIGIPLAWTAAEFIRGSVPGIGTQGYFAYALFRHAWFLQPVSIVGVHLLNLLILVVNWTLGLTVLALFRHPGVRARTVRRSVVGAAGALAVWIVVSVSLFHPVPATVTVAAIQPGVRHDDPVALAGCAATCKSLAPSVAQTRDAAARGAQLVVWREKGLGVDPQHNPVGAQLADLARQTHTYVTVGYEVVTSRGLRNEATVISPDGEYLGVYGKQHPASMFADDQTSITAGPMPVYRTPFGRLATMICFDLDFTDTARSAARDGAQILAVPSWDPPGDATKHYDLLVFRAIENRLTMVKAESAFDSAIIDPYGRILARVVTPRGSQATVIAAVPVGTGHTPLVRLGDLWGWLLTIAAVVLIAVDTVAVRRNP